MGKNLIIIGNGFDLFCKLESNFSHFFRHSFDENSEYSKASSIKMMINGSPQINYFALQKFMPTFGPQFTVFDLMFILIHTKDELLYWNDVERELYSSLNDSDFRFSWSKVLSHLNGFKNGVNSVHGYNIDYETITAKLLYNQSFNNYRQSDYTIDEFTSYLLNQLHLFEKRFADYLRSSLKNDSTYYSRASDTLKTICPDVEDIEATKIFSFNYTNPNPETTSQKYNLYNVHGTLEYDDCIIGIYNGAGKNYIEKFSKTDRQLYLNTNNKQSIDFDYDKVNNVYIFGHSFNDMDYESFAIIFENLKLKERARDITFHLCYTDIPDSGLTKENLELQVKERFTNLIKKYSNTIGESPSLFSLIAIHRKIETKYIS